MRRGFSLIEALVALAIASVCLLSLLGLQRQLAVSQRRYEAAVSRAETRRNILALVRDLNPSAQPEGAVALPAGERLGWTSRPLTAPRRALTASGGPGAFEVRLYEVTASLADGAGAVRDTVSVERMGWRRLPAAGQAPGLGSGMGLGPAPPPSAP